MTSASNSPIASPRLRFDHTPEIDDPDPFPDAIGSLGAPVEPRSSWWDVCSVVRLGAGTISALSSVAGAVVANYFYSNPTITTTAAIASGLFAQLALETTPRDIRDKVSSFNLKWSAAAFLGITQGDLQCVAKHPHVAALVCSTVQKEALIVLRLLGATWIVSSIANRVRRTKDQDDESSTGLISEAHPTIKMIEPNSATSFWISKIAQGGAGTALIVVTRLYPSLNFMDFMDDAGAFMTAYAGVTIVVREVWNRWSQFEIRHKADQEGTLRPIKTPLSLRAIRVGAVLTGGTCLCVVGALFIGVPISDVAMNGCYAGIGGIMGATKFVAQQKFTALTTRDLQRFQRRYSQPLTRGKKIETVFKLTLTAGVLGYLYWGVIQSPPEGMIALISFGSNACLSYLVTAVADKYFFRNPESRLWASLEFYLVKSPNFIALPFFVINQQMKIGSFALVEYPPARLALAYVAWGSLGAAVGHIPAQRNSVLNRSEPPTAPEVTQYLVGQYFIESYQTGV
jgi:hypothetical protein